MIATYIVPGERCRYREFVYREPIRRKLDVMDREYSANLLPPTYRERVKVTVSRLSDDEVVVTLLPTKYTLAKEPLVILRAMWALATSPGPQVCLQLLSDAFNATLTEGAKPERQD